MAKTKIAGYVCIKGKWFIDTKIKVDGEFKHVHKGVYNTLKEAREDFENVKADFIKKNTSRCAIIYFEDLVSEYEKMRRILVNESTIECDMSAFKVYMFPYFKRKQLKDVFTSDSIYNWYQKLVSNPRYTNNKKSKVITRMKDLLKFAYMHKYINPEVYQDCDVNIYQVKYSKKPKTERVVWTEEEEYKFLEAIKSNKRDDLMFRLYLATSPRLGEFLGIQPSSFKADKNKIIIQQQVKNIKGKGAVLTDKLKTHESYRTIIIAKSLSYELKKYIEDFNIQEDEFLWFNKNKKEPLSRNTIRRLFNKYCEKAGVRTMNLHALRHNQAVKLASVCHTSDEIEVAARRLGHSPSMFLNTYANHCNDEKESELLERLAIAWGEKTCIKFPLNWTVMDINGQNIVKLLKLFNNMDIIEH